MTVEAKVPLKDVKGALSAYNDLYNIITNLEVTFDYKSAKFRLLFGSVSCVAIGIILGLISFAF